MPYHFIIVHTLFCARMNFKEKVFQRKQACKILEKKTPILTTNVYHLNLTSSHKLENKIQPQ